MKKPQTAGAAGEALRRTEDKMREAERRLRLAAIAFGREWQDGPTASGDEIEAELYAAALKRTNAYHAHSRAKKHLAEFGSAGPRDAMGHARRHGAAS